MKKRIHLLAPVMLPALLSACGSAPDDSETVARGSLEMPLTASVAGVTYRLDPAVFTLTGASMSSTLDGSGVDVLEESLPVGNYTIELNEGWAMHKEDPGLGIFVPVDAELLSPSVQAFAIEEFAIAKVGYQFKVGDAVIDLNQGSLEVSIGVTTTFFGPRTNVPESELSGWSLCFADGYDNSATSVADITAACGGNQLMLACRPAGSSILSVAAHGPRNAVLRDTGEGDLTTTSRANGVEWYFNDSWSWGFAEAGAAVSKFSCDVEEPGSETRLCFHTGGGNINEGYRCGSHVSFDASYERLFYTTSF